jgi:hypothetical protein
MRKILTLLLLALGTATAQAQQTEAYGPFYNINFYGYKSNLFNSDDLRADSFQAYAFTPGFAGSLETGYLYDNGFSYSLGIQFGTNNQKYTGSDRFYPYTLTATTKSSFLKVPLVFSHQSMNDKKLKFMYSVGFFYSLNTGYSDEIVLDYTDANLPDYTTKITKKEMVTTNNKDTVKSSYLLDRRPVNTHGLGAIAGAGISYRLASRTELMVQARTEFQFTNMENNEEILMTPKSGTGVSELKHLYGNYAKYMTQPGFYRRAATRPFNFGLQIGLRFYVFTF